MILHSIDLTCPVCATSFETITVVTQRLRLRRDRRPSNGSHHRRTDGRAVLAVVDTTDEIPNVCRGMHHPM